ncbi:hypothetical protein [Bosea sp. (in: a-proteobacteria)]|uniref:hypothetical protein n=1 Tax=Bosea sp. (in: a-proteobacteria) TaxID=1871050 RepID=UPI002B47CD60|nr:hypothetical protein [Bosea sp. (in: a-proteobacteria)]WRH59986.1 MAG: hypothetical protein RSE11_09525 [Bosea sp. (in: a-proteobacteria)]
MTNAHRRTPRTCFGHISQPNGPAITDALSAMLAHAPVDYLDQWQEGGRLQGSDVPATGVSPVARNVCEIATARSWELARRQPNQHGILLPCQAEQADAARRSRVAPHRR